MPTKTEIASELQTWRNTPNFKAMNDFIRNLKAEKVWIYSTADLKDVKAYESLKKEKPNVIKPFLIDAIRYVAVLETRHLTTNQNHMSNNAQENKRIIMEVINGLMRRNLQYSDTEWVAFFSELKSTVTKLKECVDFIHFSDFPINYAIQQIERYLKNNALSETLQAFVTDMVSWNFFQNNQDYFGSDMTKARTKLQAILQSGNSVPKFTLLTAEDIGTDINELITQNTLYEQPDFHRLLFLANSARGGKPTASFTKEANECIKNLAKDTYRKFAQTIVSLAVDTPIQISIQEHGYGAYEVYEYLHGPSRDFIKGIVWTMSVFSDNTSISLLEKLIHKANTKIPGEGPVAIALANACIVTLGAMRGKDALGALSRAKLKVKQNNTKKLIDKQLEAGAKKYGVSVDELAEMAVPEFGLQV